ncbi:hypothetical protein A1O3_03936 [Capronia epimyces CBS 606.96]|uniref:Uncharacterized protein n=1 Tax=Capronia epimyces CBS 606.96 TaxID=1182542 RepID=W9YXF7_9EURO|nr:uncharacterized protein A1O3_03936 [Capronia epimyces CBS 606.96]EXJ86979.1 hypothetical protein A1O3_03936 [Capronia epimyces CBS 606.96]
MSNSTKAEIGGSTAAASLASKDNPETWWKACSEAGTARSKSDTNEQPQVESNSHSADSKEGQSAEAASPDTACLHQSYPASMATPEVSPAELDLDPQGLSNLQEDSTKPPTRP